MKGHGMLTTNEKSHGKRKWAKNLIHERDCSTSKTGNVVASQAQLSWGMSSMCRGNHVGWDLEANERCVIRDSKHEHIAACLPRPRLVGSWVLLAVKSHWSHLRRVSKRSLVSQTRR